MFDIYTLLFLICITAGCCIFLGHAAGYKRGREVGVKVGFRQASKIILSSRYGKVDNGS